MVEEHASSCQSVGEDSKDGSDGHKVGKEVHGTVITILLVRVAGSTELLVVQVVVPSESLRVEDFLLRSPLREVLLVVEPVRALACLEWVKEVVTTGLSALSLCVAGACEQVERSTFTVVDMQVACRPLIWLFSALRLVVDRVFIRILWVTLAEESERLLNLAELGPAREVLKDFSDTDALTLLKRVLVLSLAARDAARHNFVVNEAAASHAVEVHVIVTDELLVASWQPVELSSGNVVVNTGELSISDQFFSDGIIVELADEGLAAHARTEVNWA